MLIGEVVQETEVSKKTLYFYEEQGLIEPKTQKNGYRDYSYEDVEKLKTVMMLRSIGMTIADIKLYFEDVTKEKELLMKYERVLKDEVNESKERLTLCHRLVQNDIQPYIERKNIKDSSNITYPVIIGQENTEKNRRNMIAQLVIGDLLSCIIFLVFLDIPKLLIAFFFVFFLLMTLPMTFTRSIRLTEKGIYYYDSNNTSFNNYKYAFKNFFFKILDKERLFISYEDIIDAELKWLYEPSTPGWRIPKVWMNIHTKYGETIRFHSYSYYEGFSNLATIIHIISTHNIPMFDSSRIVAALDNGYELREYIDILSEKKQYENNLS